MTRPWELAQATRPWEQQEPAYNRMVSISRSTKPSTVGAVTYQARERATEVQIVAPVAASVQIASSGRNSRGDELPADSPGPIKWAIYLPGSVMATLPVLMERDIIYDDLGRRFMLAAFEPASISAHIDCVRLLN